MKVIKYIILALITLAAADVLYHQLVTGPTVIRGMYQWKEIDGSHYYSTDEEDFIRQFLDTHQVKKIYTKVLDVGWDSEVGPIPLTQTPLQQWGDSASYIPVVFIENKVFLKIAEKDVPKFAANVLKGVANCLGNFTTVTEIQFDCDWTAKSKDRYFQFLNCIKNLNSYFSYTATIRLYQYKYPNKTGVPPVDRGMLMMYNMGEPKQLSDVNSLFDVDITCDYLASSYPLTLDIALPAFSWALVYRQHQLIAVKNNVSAVICDTLKFLSKVPDHKYYTCTQDILWKGLYLRIGDIVKPESCYDRELIEAAKAARKFSDAKEINVVIFDLDTFDLNKIRHESIESAYRIFN